MENAGDGSSQSHSTQHKALSKSPPPPEDAPQTVLASLSGEVTPRTLQKVPSYADFTRMALSHSNSQGVTGANPTAPSNQPSGSRDARLAGNLTTADPLAGSSSGPRTTKHNDTSQLETVPKARPQCGELHTSTDDAQGVVVQPISSSKSSGLSTSKEDRTPPRSVPSSRAPQKTSSDASLGLPRAEELAEGNQPPLPKADLSHEGNTIKPLAQQADHITSVHLQRKPFTIPALSQPSASASSSPSTSSAPAITTTGSSWMRTAHHDDRAGIAPSESPRPPDEDKRQAYPNESSHTRAAASPREPPFPSGHVTSAVDVDSLSLPQCLDRTGPRLQEKDGVEREAKRTAEPLTSDKKGVKQTTASKEPEIHQEDPTTDPYSAQRLKLESSPPSSHAPDIKQHPKAPPQSSLGFTSSSSVSPGYDLGATHLPATSEFGGNTGRSDAISSPRITEASVTPCVPLSTQNQVKHAVSTPSNNLDKPKNSSTDSSLRPPTVVGDSQIHASHFMSRTTSSLVSVPSTSTTSGEAKREEEMRTGSLHPSKPGDDSSSRLPDSHYQTETRNPGPSLVQVDSPQEEVENKSQAKPSNRTQPAHAPPSIINLSSNIEKDRVSQAQHGRSISQPQHSQSESSRILPNQQHRTDPSITRETGLPSEYPAAIGAPSFTHFRPVLAYVPVHPDEIYDPERSPPLPPYESGPLGVPVAQEGAPSRSGTRIPGEARDEPKKLPASLVLEASRHRDDKSHMDRPEELKRLLLPTRDDAVAAVCPPPDHSQSVEVYRSDRSHSPHGVRQLEALSSPKILDRSRSGNSMEQTTRIPLAPQKRGHDPPIADIQQEVESHETGSFDDEDRGRRPQVRSDEVDDGRPLAGQKDDGARGSQLSHRRVPQVEVIPPTPRESVVGREKLKWAPSDMPPVPAPPAPTPPAPTPPAPTPPVLMPPVPTSSPRRPASSPRRRKKGILGRICPCLG